MKELPDKANLRPDEVAEFFDITKKTVYRWIKKGLLEATSPPGCALRISRDSILKHKKLRKEMDNSFQIDN